MQHELLQIYLGLSVNDDMVISLRKQCVSCVILRPAGSWLCKPAL